MTEKESKFGDAIPLLGAVALAGAGIYLATRKPPLPPIILPGDTITISSCSFGYQGQEADIFLCWGLRKGSGDFNNGEALLGGLWAWGGPIHVLGTLKAEPYNIKPDEELETKPRLYLDPAVVVPGNYQTYVWITKDKPFKDRDKEFLSIMLTGQKPFSWEGWIRVKAETV